VSNGCVQYTACVSTYLSRSDQCRQGGVAAFRPRPSRDLGGQRGRAAKRCPISHVVLTTTTLWAWSPTKLSAEVGLYIVCDSLHAREGARARVARDGALDGWSSICQTHRSRASRDTWLAVQVVVIALLKNIHRTCATSPDERPPKKYTYWKPANHGAPAVVCCTAPMLCSASWCLAPLPDAVSHLLHRSLLRPLVSGEMKILARKPMLGQANRWWTPEL